MLTRASPLTYVRGGGDPHAYLVMPDLTIAASIAMLFSSSIAIAASIIADESTMSTSSLDPATSWKGLYAVFLNIEGGGLEAMSALKLSTCTSTYDEARMQ